MDLVISNTESFGQLAKSFRAAGLEGKGLKKDLRKQINREVKPAKLAAKANARAILPKRGGLARRVAATTLSTSTRFTGNVGVSIRGKGKAGAAGVRQIDGGTVTHPVFGRRTAWVTQRVRPGWFTKAMQEREPHMKRAVLEAVNDTTRRLR